MARFGLPPAQPSKRWIVLLVVIATVWLLIEVLGDELRKLTGDD